MTENDRQLEQLLLDGQREYARGGMGRRVAVDLLQRALLLMDSQSSIRHSIQSNWMVARLLSSSAQEVPTLLQDFSGDPSRISVCTDCHKLHNIASAMIVCCKYDAALYALDRVKTLTTEPRNYEQVGIRFNSAFLRIEVLLQLVGTKRYTNAHTNVNILRQMQDAVDVARDMCRKHLFAAHVAFVPKDCDVRYLAPPAPLQGERGSADQWQYSAAPAFTNEHTPISRYGYLLLVGLVVEFRILMYCARHALLCNRLAQAKESIRSAMALYARYLKCIESKPSCAEIATTIHSENTATLPLSPQGICSLHALVGKCGNYSPTSSESMTYQINRQHGIAMEVLARFYFRTNGLTDALNTLCGSMTSQPMPLYYALNTVNTGRRGACISNNKGCVLLQMGKPHSAALLFRQSQGHSASAGSVVCSEGYTGSLRTHDLSAARYNEALVQLKLNQPLPALSLLGSIEGALLQRPHICIRKAECRVLHHHLLCSATDGTIEVQSMRTEHSDKHLIRFDQDRKVNSARLLTLVESALVGGASGSNAYVEDCVQYVSPVHLPCDASDPARVQFVVDLLLKAASLRQAVSDLSTALNILNSALKRATGDSVVVASLLGMKAGVLLKLTYLHLWLDNPHSAVLCSEELLQLPPSTSVNTCRHLVVGYHVEILCRLGREHEAAVALKSNTVVTVRAWQDALRGGAELEDSGDAVTADSSAGAAVLDDAVALLSPSLFFSGTTRITQLRDAPAAHGTLVKQLLRVDDAVVLMLRCEMDAARVILEDVVRTDKDLVPAVQNLVYVYIKQGKVYDALGLLKVLQCMPAAV